MVHFRILFRCEQIHLCGRGENANADFLGDYQIVFFLGAVAENVIRMGETGDAEAVLRLVVVDAVTAYNHGTALIDLFVSSGENGFYRIDWKAVREGEQVHGQLWSASHGVDVAEGVRRCNLTENVRIIYNRREEVDAVNQCNVIGNPIDAGIVTAVESDHYVRIFDFRQIGKNIA